jgi:DNA-binding NarL/FixJ family response regulator
VLVADDQAIVREGLAMVLGLSPGIVVVGTAVDGDEARV